MGVKWLTTYLQGVERIVSSQVTFPVNAAESSSSAVRPTFVVDAWAFIYHVYLSQHGDAIRGLDYQAFQYTLQSIIEAWQSAAILVILVFDGPNLPGKVPTIVRRRAGRAASSPSYMKASAASRSSLRLQRDCGVVPPLLLYATIEACRKSQVEMIFAPTEADSLVAEIATKREEGYAVSLDSDYFILCARGRCCPYVPLDSIEYIVEMPTKEQATEDRLNADNGDDDAGFQQVTGRKRGGTRYKASLSMPSSAPTRQSRSIPPGAGDETSLSAISIRAYRPQDLASHLGIQPTLLPLLAALVGNDYTTSIQSNILFRQHEGPQRISEAALILRTEWLKATKERKRGSHETKRAATGSRNGQARLPSKALLNEDAFDEAKSDTLSSAASSAMATPTRYAPEPHREGTNGQDPVRAIVNAIVAQAIDKMEAGVVNPRYSTTTGEKELIVDSVIDSVATYSLLTHSDAPHLASPSALFFGHPSSLMVSTTAGSIASPEAIKLYRQAYEQGHFTPTLIEALTGRIFISTLCAEDVDVKSTSVLEARELREWLWSILFEAWGMDWARKEMEVKIEPVEEEGKKEEGGMAAQLSVLDRRYKEGEKPEDLISVDTESSQSVTLHEDRGDDLDDLPTRPGSVAELHRDIDKPAPVVEEYVRRANLYVAEPVQILPLREMLQGELVVGRSLPPSLAEVRECHTGQYADGHAPVVLSPLETRIALFLHAHRAYTPAIQALDRSWWPIAASLRLAIQYQARALGPVKRKLNWSRDELVAALQSASHAENSSKKKGGATGSIGDEVLQEVLPSTRSIHLSSTIQLLLESSHLLAQALLLPVDVPTWPQPHTSYHGPTFHHRISEIDDQEDRSGTSPSKEVNTVLKAVIAGLEDDLGIGISELRRERKAKKKEAKEKEKIEGVATGNRSNARQTAARNAFALLGEDTS